MPAIQASRRLVKSPPELWAEVSDAASLARHLGEVGEITITRLEPETTVAWEGEHASGTVELAPAGWGTSVTLTAEPTAAAEPTAPAEPEPVAAESAVAPEPPIARGPLAPEPEVVAAEPESEPIAGERERQPAAIAEPEATPEPPAEPEATGIERTTPIAMPLRRVWLTRLFRRRTQEPQKAPARESQPTTEPEPSAADADRAGGVAEDDSAAPPAESPRATTGPARQAAEPETEATDPLKTVLTQALDSLGQAHHRPFSRG